MKAIKKKIVLTLIVFAVLILFSCGKDNNNGEVQLWINGEEALLRTDIRFVNDGSLVDTFYFSTFHGGNDSNWAPSVDCYIWYDDLRIFY